MNEARKLLLMDKTYEAVKRLQKIYPEYKGTRDEWRILDLFGAVFHDLGDADGAAQSYFNAARVDKYLRVQRLHYSNYLFNIHYLSNIDNETLAHEHLVYEYLFKQKQFNHENHSYTKTIGYIADNFCESAAARFYEVLLLNHSDDFTIKCFSLSDDCDEFTNRIKNSVDDYFVLKNLSLEESAQKIYDEKVDILFDLNGHSEGGMTLQIMSYKPAPIQMTGIGWIDTTGLLAVDYLFTDRYISHEQEMFFSEVFIRLNGALAFIPSTAMKNNPKIKINHSQIHFGCFNNFMKVTDEYLQCVQEILNQTDSRFIMQDTTKIPARKIEMECRLQKLNMPMERIEIRLGNDNYLDDYSDVDIMLDTFPYNGGMMTATALYMNVPVISLKGERYSSRFSAGILRLANHSELITESKESYVKKAVDLSKNFTHQNLNIESSHLCNTERFMYEVEFMYRKLMGY